MQKFSLTFLAVTIAALFVAEFSSGHPTDIVLSCKNDRREVGDSPSCKHSVDKIGCKPSLDRCDYVAVPGLGAYKFHKRPVTWNEARKICLMEGAHLAVLDSAKKEALFKDWMSKESLSGVWLGFHDLYNDEFWTTVTGEVIDTMGYQPWAKEEPNNAGGTQHCGVLWQKFKEGGADDINCETKTPFVCEIDLCNSSNPTTARINDDDPLSALADTIYGDQKDA